MQRLLASAFVLFALASAAVPAAGLTPTCGGQAKVFLSREEALELAFPKCERRRLTTYLTKAQTRRIAELAKVPFEKSVVFAYEARRKGELVGTAYFDTHKVRTHREVLMVVVDPASRIRRIEVLAFAEPVDYLPRGAWYAQFLGRALDDELELKRAIKGVTGATLTARATTAAARRLLAVHQVRGEISREKKGAAPGGRRAAGSPPAPRGAAR
ncbi:MAG: FMN-binding protein [Planctomycetota bacterium]|jgi:hypothetical protein|nr:FMN-binding protein [Planctomycetota bacterium]MDP6763981.1 FMN-binding protein [Planctomycetota bacterium]MDP6988356.1 FMN-binding protein [Planctomycetota bacterium]